MSGSTSSWPTGSTTVTPPMIPTATARTAWSVAWMPPTRASITGGDLRGVIDRLDYIEGLGTTAIWLTPTFENRPVQGVGDAVSAGYQGYWITDFTQIDPHPGTNDELRELVDAAHERAIKASLRA